MVYRWMIPPVPPVFYSVIYWSIFAAASFWVLLPIVLSILAVSRLLCGSGALPKLPKSSLLGFLGLRLPVAIRLALETSLGRSIPRSRLYTPVRRHRGVLKLATITGVSEVDRATFFQKIASPNDQGCFHDLVLCTIRRRIYMRNGSSVKDVLVDAGFADLLVNERIYASQASRIVAMDTLGSDLLPGIPIFLNVRVLGGASTNPTTSGSASNPDTARIESRHEQNDDIAALDSDTDSEIEIQPIVSKKGKETNTPRTRRKPAIKVAKATKRSILKKEDGGSGEELVLFKASKWPLSARASLRPLVEHSGVWDEDLASRCLRDMIEAWIQFQSPGYRSDYEKMDKSRRSHFLAARATWNLEPIIGWAGPARTGPLELRRPDKFYGVVRWVRRVYEAKQSTGQHWIKAPFLSQFLNVDTPTVTTEAKIQHILPTSMSHPLPEPQYSQLSPLDDEEYVPTIEEIESLPTDAVEMTDGNAQDDPESVLDRLQAVLWKQAKSRARKEGNDALLPDAPGSLRSWRPRLFKSEPLYGREDLLATLRSRLMKTAYNDSKSFSSDKRAIELAIADFMARVLEPKTTKQLRLIQLLPDVMVTPALLQLTGLSDGIATDHTSVIYVKFAVGGPAILDTLSSSPRPASQAFANRLNRFLRSPLPEHLSTVPPENATPDRSQLHYSHVGRFTSGVSNRQWWEHTGIMHYRKEKGARVWIECLASSGAVSKKTVYHILADHSHRIGGDWAKKMGMDELFFSTLLLNPFLTNLGWPGTGLPEPPAFIGEKISLPDSSRSWLGKTTLKVAARSYGCDADSVTIVCLQWLGWKGKNHPVDWLYENRETIEDNTRRPFRHFRLVSRLGELFPIPWLKTGPLSLESEFRLFVASPQTSRSELTLRPAGVQRIDRRANIDLAPEQRAITVAVDAGSARQRSAIHHTPSKTGNLAMSLQVHPAYKFPDGQIAYTLVDEYGMNLRNGPNISIAPGGSLIVRISLEASQMLHGVTLPAQDCTDLAIWPDVVKMRLAGAQTTISKASEAIGESSKANAMELSPIPEDLVLRWTTLMADLEKSKTQLYDSIILATDEAIDDYTLDPASRGYTTLLDSRMVLLRTVRGFIADHDQTYNLSELPDIEHYRPSSQ